MDSNTSSNRSIQSAYLIFWANLSSGLLGFISNFGACLIISTHSVLRQPFHYLILNLSFSDILVSRAVMLDVVLDYFSASYYMIYRTLSTICHVNDAFLGVSLPATCLTLLMISVERYQALAIVRLRSLKLSTVSRVIVVIWLLATMKTIIPIVYTKLDLHYQHECAIGRIDNFQILILLTVSLVLTSVIPIGIMFVVYVMILYKLIGKLPIAQPTSSVVMSKQEKLLRCSILPVLCISISSAASSIPYLVFIYYTSFNQHYIPSFRATFISKYDRLWIVTSALFSLTPIVNPLLYNLASSKFREILYSLVCGRCCSTVMRIPTPIKIIRVEGRKSSTTHTRILSVYLPPTNKQTVL